MVCHPTPVAFPCLVGGIVDFVEREYDLDGKKVTMQVWDTAGQEQYDSITTSYFRSAVVSV